MRETPLQKVRCLIALAASPYEQEARTSAFLACKLIREHGFRVVEASARDRDEPYSPPPPPPSPPEEEAKPAPKPRVIQARFGARCRACGQWCDEGSTIWWKRGVGCTHYECGTDAL